MAEDYKALIENSPKKFVGLKQVLRGITDGVVWCVILSSDCEEFIKKAVREAAHGKKIAFKSAPTMAELGKAAKIDVGAAVVGLIK